MEARMAVGDKVSQFCLIAKWDFKNYASDYIYALDMLCDLSFFCISYNRFNIFS